MSPRTFYIHLHKVRNGLSTSNWLTRLLTCLWSTSRCLKLLTLYVNESSWSQTFRIMVETELSPQIFKMPFFSSVLVLYLGLLRSRLLGFSFDSTLLWGVEISTILFLFLLLFFGKIVRALFSVVLFSVVIDIETKWVDYFDVWRQIVDQTKSKEI